MREMIINLLHEITPDITGDETINLVEDGVIDSFDIANLVTSLEEAFDIEIDGEDIVPENFYNIMTIERLIIKTKQP